MLLLVTMLLGLVAMAALAGVVSARREARDATRIARARARSLNELLRTVRMAESIADLGIWQYDPNSGQQQWSRGMRLLFGVDKDEEFVPGDAETLLFANDIDLVGDVLERRQERDPFTLHYDINGYDGKPRSISVQACSLKGLGGEAVRIVAVVRDITDQVSRERALESSRLAAEREATKARRLAETDALTGLANRRLIMGELDRLILDARHLGRPLALLMFDLDRFKAVNDTYGHLVGDRVLERVARVAREQSRAGDLIGRVGGEEFVWIAPGIELNAAYQLAERLRRAIAANDAQESLPRVTVSVGVSVLRSSDTSLGLFSRTDSALYEAKNSGRNRVMRAEAA
ncbi:MAG: sensor domain-containing diguanylate cyclase [Pseudomonadota bacterium]